MDGVTRLDPARLGEFPPAVEAGAETVTAELFSTGDGLTAGVWDAEPMGDAMAPYPVDEVCVLIEGTVELHFPDGSAEIFGPGEAFAIRKGTELRWVQPERVRKFYVIREG
jgi:uncharacterized cupin superfamily protein